MNKMIGEVTLLKTNIETGEVSEQVEYNTQLTGIYLNQLTSAPIAWNNTATQDMIYISDTAIPLNRMTASIVSTASTFLISGATISGEFWPQYAVDPTNSRGVITFKRRFTPPLS